jgi:hypothetical protein
MIATSTAARSNEHAWRAPRQELFPHPRRYTASRVVEHLRALLRTPRYSTRAEEVGRIVRTEDGTEQACQALEAFIQARGRSAALPRPH